MSLWEAIHTQTIEIPSVDGDMERLESHVLLVK
jgi:hypothetical protein